MGADAGSGEHAGDEDVAPGDEEDDWEEQWGAPAEAHDPAIAADGGEGGILTDHLVEEAAPAADGDGAADDAEEDEDATGDGEKGDEGEEEIVADAGRGGVPGRMRDGECGEEECLCGKEPTEAGAGEIVLMGDLVADGLVAGEIDCAGMGLGHLGGDCGGEGDGVKAH